MKKFAFLRAAMPAIFLTIPFYFFFSETAYAQADLPRGLVAKKVALLKQNGSFSNGITLFALSSKAASDPQISNIVKKYALLNTNGIEAIQRSRPDFISFSVPVERGGRQLKLLLYKESISPNGFTLLTDKGVAGPGRQDIVHYRGSIDNDLNSVAAFTFAGDEISGLINNKEGNYVIGKTGRATGEHIIYNDKDLIIQQPFDCATNTAVPISPVKLARPGETAAITSKCVNWYWETDYDLFVNKGSVDSVNAYMQAIFNQMATLYANDGMTMVLKTLFVWSTEDPYTGTSTSGYLDQFGAYRTSFNGDLAHLIGLKGGGGIAWINGACKTNKYRMAYSGISSTYRVVPTFSWSVECVTHEQGHLLGSPHTHDCSWNGNNTKIDGCGDAAGYPSGSCAVPALPAGGGTIMSYCHLTSVGINFNLGFGPQPTTLMINTINAASCLVACSSCAVPAQPGPVTGSSTVCTSSTYIYSVPATAGATSYIWSLPSGWSGTSSTNSITVTAGTAAGNISVTAHNSCGNSTAQTLTVTTGGVPSQPGVISGNTAVCSGTAQTYTIAAVPQALSYTWTLPSGWSGSSTTNNLTVTTGTSGGILSVKANNSCGSSAVTTVAITITAAAPAQPSAIAGNPTGCSGSPQSYSVASVAGVTSYVWSLPAGWTGSSTTNSIIVTAGSAAGTISAAASNGCGTSTASRLTVNTSSLPAVPGTITVSGGAAAICTGDVRTYTTPLVSSVTYNWMIPAGTTVVNGQGTNSIQLSFGSGFISGSSLTVQAVNSCGSSGSSGIIISKTAIGMPGGIVVSGGYSKVCPGDVRTYMVSQVTGITYSWTAPPGALISSGQGTNKITLSFTSSFTVQGTLSVTANNNCGTSAARTLTITRNILSAPGTVSGPTTVCPNTVSTYSVPPVSDLVSYSWTVPAGATIQGISTGRSIQVLLGSAGGSISVRAVNACGSSNSSSKTVTISCTSGSVEFSAMKAMVYPNPASSMIKVEFTAAGIEHYTISITDITGRLIVKEAAIASRGINVHSFNVSKFSKGAFLISILGKTEKQLLRLNVE